MSKTVGVLILHGIGTQKSGYADDLISGIETQLGQKADEVVFKEVLYSDIFDEIANAREHYLLESSSQWHILLKAIRKLLIFFFSDATSYKDKDGYARVQIRLSENLDALINELDSSYSIVIAAHSLGAMVVSDYLYDLQKCAAHLTKIENVKALVTFGCNIPLFEMGHKKTVSIERPSNQFAWENFYSPFDVLGYKMEGYYDEDWRTGKKPDFIKDFKIYTGNLFTSWNVFSHIGYWKDSRVHQAISNRC